MKAYYFAYGSNMSQSRLEERVGKVKKIQTIRLSHSQLVFNCGYGKNRFANIVYTDNSADFVEGVLYELSENQLLILDEYEGVELHAYKRVSFKYGDFLVYTYIACTNYLKDTKRKPLKKYMRHIFKGCYENGFKDTLNYLHKKGLKKFKVS